MVYDGILEIGCYENLVFLEYDTEQFDW